MSSRLSRFTSQQRLFKFNLTIDKIIKALARAAHEFITTDMLDHRFNLELVPVKTGWLRNNTFAMVKTFAANGDMTLRIEVHYNTTYAQYVIDPVKNVLDLEQKIIETVQMNMMAAAGGLMA